MLTCENTKVEYECVGTGTSGHGHAAARGDQRVVQISASQGIPAGRSDHKLRHACCSLFSGRVYAAQRAAVPLGGDEGIALHRSGIGVAQNEVRQRGVLYLIQGLLIEALVLEVVAIAVAQSGELVGDDYAEGGPDDRSWRMILSQSTGPQIDGIDRTIGFLERCCRRRIRAELIEAGVRRKPQRLPGLVQCTQPKIMAALDIDRCQIHAVRRIEQEVSQAIDNVSVQRVGQVPRQMPQQAIRTSRLESRRVFEERLRQRLLRREGTQIAGRTDLVGDDGVTEAKGRTGKLFGDPRVRRAVIALVWLDGVLAQQMRQELVVGDVDHLGRGDGLGRLV
ncbi:hypothetical protein ABIF62_005257 [Bradyrhizobium japonicum]